MFDFFVQHWELIQTLFLAVGTAIVNAKKQDKNKEFNK